MSTRFITGLIFLVTLAVLVLPLFKQNADSKMQSRKSIAEQADSLAATRPQRFAEGNVDARSVVFLGNSLTELFDLRVFGKTKIVNHGISGDMTIGVLRRLHSSTGGHPAKIFLEIGINDLIQGFGEDEVLNNYTRILDSISAQSPQTKIHVISLLPNCIEHGEKLNETVRRLNEKISALCSSKKITWIDLFTPMLSEDGRLKKEFAVDGLHLTATGYAVWAQTIQPYLND